MSKIDLKRFSIQNQMGKITTLAVIFFVILSTTFTTYAHGDDSEHSDGRDNEKITICHATHSETNPYVEITISSEGLHGHDDHDGDIIPAPFEGCPGAIVENTPPVITILGDNPLVIDQGDTFTDPGATAADLEDGDLTSQIVTTGVVDTSILGTTTINYNVTDSGGLTNSSSRDVVVVADSGGGGGGGITGSIEICKIIVNNDGVVATSSSDLPAGSFSVTLSQGSNATSSTVVQNAVFNSQSFSPNKKIIGSENDAECITYNNLSLSSHYYYSEENVLGSDWQAGPLYNDQFTITVASTSDFFTYSPELFNDDVSDDETRNLNSDGNINLTENRPSRTLVLLNEYSATSTSTATNTPPAITIIGDNPMTIYQGDIFTDPGATSTDLEDGDLTLAIIATSTVSTTTVGSYYVTYTVTDSGGLSASTTRTVNVVTGTSTTTPPGGGGGGSGGGGSTSGSRRGGFVSDQSVDGVANNQSCSYLNDYLRIDLPNNLAEVVKLQAFLRTFEGETGLSVTGIFDQATFDAVGRFQTKYKDEILTPWGYTEPTGYVYILTKKKVNEIFCNSTLPVNSTEQSEIDAFRDLLERLRQSGVSVPAGGAITPEGQNVNPGNQVGKAVNTNINLLASAIGVSTSTGLASTTNSNLRNIAAAVFAFPQGLGDTVKCGLELILTLAIIYILATVVAGGEDNKRSLEEIRNRKLIISIIGLIAGVLAGVFLQIYCIVVPLLVILVIVASFLLWRLNKK